MITHMYIKSNTWYFSPINMCRFYDVLRITGMGLLHCILKPSGFFGVVLVIIDS